MRVGQVSAPVFDHTGRVAASLLVPGPDLEITSSELRVLGSRLVEAANNATREAGVLDERGNGGKDDFVRD